MKPGFLSQYFEGVAVKRLSAVEADVLRSNQHEFNGVEPLRRILGEPTDRVQYPATFLYLTDADEDPSPEAGFLTWYDARQKGRVERGVMRWEYRLYFPTTIASQLASEGDLLVVAKRPDGSLLSIIAEGGSTIQQQLLWLFGISNEAHPGFVVRDDLETEQDRLAFASRLVLESIGVVLAPEGDNLLDEMLAKFGERFPSTAEFSSFARSTMPDLRVKDGADDALLAWMEREEVLFRTLEKHIIATRLAEGFHANVDEFLAYSLSVQNRRKSRAGSAFEHHVAQALTEVGIRFARGETTEFRSKPDFLFPGAKEYRDTRYDESRLTMLAVKSTCKDRWRQILSEATRIPQKHLLTLEAAISENQTAEMVRQNVRLVVPRRLHTSFSESQQRGLLGFRDFCDLVLARQST